MPRSECINSVATARTYSHIESPKDQIGRHRSIHGPAQNAAAPKIQNGSQESPSLGRGQVRDVAHPCSVECSGSKIAPSEVGIDKHVVIAVGCFDGTFEMTVPDDAVDTQNASEPFDSDANASLTHERVHLTVPGGVFHFVADDFGLFEHSLIGNDLLALHRHALALNPCVIAADTDLKYLATLGYRAIFEFRILKGSLNKGVPH